MHTMGTGVAQWFGRFALAWLSLAGPAMAQQGASSLTIVSWNLQWLADPAVLKSSGFWARCKAQNFPDRVVVDGLPPCTAVAAHGRTAAAYEARKLAPLRDTLSRLATEGMDVLAVQEVGSPAALQAVLPAGWRVACFSRPLQAQSVGYAVRETSSPTWECSQFDDLSLPPQGAGTGRYRPGLELTAPMGGAEGPKLAILNVHLKASCSIRDMSSAGHDQASDCATLQRQVPMLESWVERQAESGTAFMIVGDWNRDLEREIRHGRPARTDGSAPSTPPIVKRIRYLWPELNDGAPDTSAMSLALVDRKAAMAVGCHANLDQVAVSRSLLARLQPASLAMDRLAASLLPGPPASDHCPLRASLRW